MYTLSIGLNDKQTLKQIVSTVNAIAIIKAQALRLGGYSMGTREGAYTMDDGIVVEEVSIILDLFLDRSKQEQVSDMVNRLCLSLNQETIAVEYRDSNTGFWRLRNHAPYAGVDRRSSK